MSKKITILQPSKIELDQFSFDKLYKTAGQLIKSTVKYSGKPFRVNTPTMFLGADVSQCDEYLYVDLAFNQKNQKSRSFSDVIRNIDYLIISEIFENGKSWFVEQSTEPSLCQIEANYVTTIKLSTISSDQPSLKVKAPIGSVEFYDQDGSPVPVKLLKQGYPATALLELSNVYKNETHIWADWNLLQIKVTLPENILKGCHLVDIDDNDSIYEDVEGNLDDLVDLDE